jgi:hypothetical protein
VDTLQETYAIGVQDGMRAFGDMILDAYYYAADEDGKRTQRLPMPPVLRQVFKSMETSAPEILQELREGKMTRLYDD